MRELTHLSLFSGIGGLDLAAEWAGIKTVGQCEWADYPIRVLEKHWPDVPRWKDIRTLTGESFYEWTGRRTVDIISGGFPCQPFSVAGKQRGKEDDRYLWPEMVRVIKELRPAWIVGENVAGIVRMALPDILSELEACGYRTRTFLVPACAVGARHRRYRVAIVAYSNSDGRLHGQNEVNAAETWEQAQRQSFQCRAGAGNVENPGSFGRGKSGDVCEQQGRAEFERTGEVVADTESQSSGGLPIREGKEESRLGGGGEDVQYTDSTGRKEQHTATKSDKEGFAGWGCDKGNVSNANGGFSEWKNKKIQTGRNTTHSSGTGKREWTVKSLLGGMADGISSRVDGDFLINHYWDEEPDVPRVAVGVPHRVDRLKCLGNAVVPQQFYPVFKAISEIELMR